MTTPNIEELIAALIQTNQFHESADICTADVIDVLQSQAARIKELERESETHAKAYGLAIVERDNLRHELKTAQEGWRCECSTDDACRFARERDALRAELAEIAADEPVMFAYEYSDGSWHDASSTEHSAGMKPLFTRPMPVQPIIDKAKSVASHYFDIEGNLYTANRAKFLRPSLNGLTPLFTRPMPAQDVTELVEALEKLARLGNGEHYGNSDGNMIARTALSKYKGAK